MALSDNYTPTRTQGNGTTDTFTFSWNGINTDFVKVHFENVSTGVQTEQTTGFTKSLNSDPSTGGQVVFTTPPANTVYVIISRNTPKSHEQQYNTSSGFPAKTVETDFDKAAAMQQEATEFESRAFKFPLGTDVDALGYSVDMPLPSSGKFLAWNSGATALENVTSVTSTDYQRDISFGLDASKAASPASADIYVATDTSKVYVCFSAGTWTEVTIVSTAQTLTNKRITKRHSTTTSTATLTPETDTYDEFTLSAQAANLTIANQSTTTPDHGDTMLIAIKDNGTARTITFGSNYVAKAGVDLPTTTVLGKWLTLGFKYNASLAKWNLLALGQEA